MFFTVSLSIVGGDEEADARVGVVYDGMPLLNYVMMNENELACKRD